ncbi:hydrogenase maturation nickel metallochaperone HypA [Thioalkalicoccus limnaeus]|uniref:Hydrogenase maturation factor HypA n=1 Tax=Thioalkalicoccus limnaeus TaxID=120681 RepID=A0ABV4BGJ9_9GAMM
MHELSICLALLDQVQDIARDHGATSVDRIRLHIGPLSGVEATLIQQAYPLVAAGTLAEHAELIIDAIPVRVYCNQCGDETEVKPNRLLCGRCGGHHIRIVSGTEMLLAHLEMTRPDD